MFTVPVLELTEVERAELQRRVRAHTTTQRALKRSRCGAGLRGRCAVASDRGRCRHRSTSSRGVAAPVRG